MFATLRDYSLAVAPGLVVFAACLVLARRLPSVGASIAILIAAFILIRDAMTPAGLWRFGAADGVAPWIRFTEDTGVLAVLAVLTLALTAVVLAAHPGLRALVVWGRPTPVVLALGVGGAALAAAPVLAVSQAWPMDERGGAVAVTALPVVLAFCLAGNLFEEVLFRGFLQGHLERVTSPVRAALLSGLLFAACHGYLATTVTDTGWPLIAFTAWEGLVCAWLRMRHGLIPAVLAHGLAIAALTSGLA
ncbi:hypothetical protein LX16_4456 [Stackebrandtia albiflava]|uniref:CAAX prenyl protease 2/Lysostaphin resistance protein A-like domain-containing protein n=1 Tax=Stackebrandtia albiflava TaxID=406432 RepID=A0A562URJ8_9ACTN|nr:CPBP family intramembrane glutamic endopeptidase [Stackebrandtia albiflava]TWJ08231.1 hypothetical protein LX16_4456 [Stackebrandtia albiflava]